ncbi:hypothetical protein Lal_00035106 [Lupinus albus]|uniref:Putative S-layer domain-containing protein n=1 Tax=Lupinus albus TaxID=3870 RepID=A0A6A4QV64_LUPAL|nr:putative S-layer domain-containing protein [Lupinus albus]KAF1897402.1 hypothetical protein Lal_00035106 [Lupinus albus]
MASITPTSSPTSLQLRFAFNAPIFKKFPITHSRIPTFNPRFPLTCNVSERVPGDSSWVGSNSKSDGLSGWTDSESDEKSNNKSQKKELYEGVVRVGVAGVILSGIAFAAFSLSKRTSFRSEQQLKPLTAQQEVFLSSDNHNDEITEQVNAGYKVEQGNINTEGQIDTSNDYSSPEPDSIQGDYRNVDDSDDIRNTSNGIRNATKHISIPEDIHHESTLDDKLGESENTADSFNAYGLRDFDTDPAVDTIDSTAELEEIPFSVEPGNIPNDDAKPTQTEQQDEIISSGGHKISDISNPSSSGADNETETGSVALNSDSSDTISDPEFYPQDDQQNFQPASSKESHDSNKIPEVSDVGNKAYLEEQRILENDLFRESSTNTLIDGKIASDNNEVIKSIPESLNSGSFFSLPGIPAPSVVSAAVKVLPGKVLIPAAFDQVQGQALAALQVLKVIEPDVQPGDLCTRREYARWLVSASSALSRNTISKVYPAMYIDNVTELAFDDITHEDPDFCSIQGLAEAGLIESKLSRCDIQLSTDEDNSPFYFSPESPLSRQDLVSWKMALEKRQLPEADRKKLYHLSGFIDTDKIHPSACPALVADLSAGEHGIIALAFGYTRLFQPDKPVTKAQAAIALATGDASDIVSEELARIEAESMAENAVAAHSALVAQVEKDVNASFERELLIEREKINAVERMAEEARLELERLRAEREEENISLMKERAAIESEMEVFSRLRHEVEDQLESLMNDKVATAYEKERINKLQEQAEVENKEISRLQYELEVERKALSMARTWAEDEARRVREQAKALEEARDRWERQGIKVIVDDDLREEASAEVTWLNAGEQFSVQGRVDRADSLLDKIKKMATEIRGKSRDTIDKIIHTISLFISKLSEWACKTGKQAEDFREAAILKAGKSAHELQQSAFEVGFAIKESAKRVADDCREGVEKLTQKFKT